MARCNSPWPLFIILQAFKGDSWPVMPSPEQIRAQMYTAITHGATGLWLFTGFINDGNLTGIVPGMPQWNAASQTNHEIDAYKKIFLSKTSTEEYHVSVEQESVSNNIHTMLKDAGEAGIRYLLAVNLTPNATQTQFTFTRNYISVTSLFDSRNIPINGNTFTDVFYGYGVHLYKVSIAPTPLPGDLNDDYAVNRTDFYDLFMPFFGQSGTAGLVKADINNDGRVDIYDYNILVGNFGRTN